MPLQDGGVSSIDPNLARTDSLLTNCDREPIHVPGTIQPHGILLVVDPVDLMIRQASINGEPAFRRPIDQIVRCPLRDILNPVWLELIEATIDAGFDSPTATFVAGSGAPLSIHRGSQHQGSQNTDDANSTSGFHLMAHVTEAGIVLEFEQNDFYPCAKEPPAASRGLPLRELMRRLGEAKTIEAMGDAICGAVEAQTQFDRVLLYRFEPNWNGIVVSERNNGRLPSYLHHRFPAHDIPAQARELYRVNPVRIIPSADFVPVTLVPVISPATNKPLDMTAAVLRSVSPVHIQYMQNMQTAASMSISILNHGELWGLIACHHSQPMHVPYPQRIACEQFAEAFSLRLSAVEQIHDFRQHRAVRNAFTELLASMSETRDIAAALSEKSQELLQLTGAQGAAVVVDGSCTLMGETPDEAQVFALADWLFTRVDEEQYSTDALSSAYPPATQYVEVASGLMAIAISKRYPSYVLWFRPEVVRTVPWAGDPHRVEAFEEHPAQLHPRTSFETWRETVRGRSTAWAASECDGAAELRNAIVGMVLRKAEELAELNEELSRSNRELEAFSYSVSHDLRAPLRHIVGYAEMLKSYGGNKFTEQEERCIATIIESSEYAGRLVDKLLNYSRLGQANLQLTQIDMDTLFREVCRDAMREAGDRQISWVFTSFPEVSADLMMIRMAVRDLISNAVKYTRHEDVAIIEVGYREEPEQHVFWVKDNGVGFDMKYADKLFGVFQRLHRWEDFEGTGIGLANVRRVIERHGGRTWADATEGVGANFFFTLPIPPNLFRS
jgi:light-regulated signal transduction histidine kinase (bacteriophytochrome)